MESGGGGRRSTYEVDQRSTKGSPPTDFDADTLPYGNQNAREKQKKEHELTKGTAYLLGDGLRPKATGIRFSVRFRTSLLSLLSATARLMEASLTAGIGSTCGDTKHKESPTQYTARLRCYSCVYIQRRNN